jgi:ATP-dependent DNA helicase Rep
VPLLEACADLGLDQHLSGRARTRIQHFVTLIDRFAERAQGDDPARTARELVEELDYRFWLKESSGSDQAAARRWDNVTEFIDWLGRLRRGEREKAGLAELVNHLSLLDILERQDEEQGGDRVALMTLHSAKGLEFPHVFLVGLEEGLLPHHASLEDDNLEEERRLAYVGITRARRTLTLTLAKRRRRYGELIPCEPSRFLEELPADNLLRVGEDSPEARAESRRRGSAHLAGLKSLLG